MKLCWVSMLVVLVVVWGSPGAARSLEPLVHDLRTGDETTRMRAVLALGHSGDPQAVELLRQALHDESQLVRTHARQALRRLLRMLAHTSRLITHWLDELLERLEEPQVTTVKRPSELSRAAVASDKPPVAGRKKLP